MNDLNLFPARVPIGTDSRGGNVLMTREFSKSLSSLQTLLGGTNGLSLTDIRKAIARLPSTLAQSSTPITLAGSIDPKVLAAVTVPAGVMGNSGMVRVTTTWSVTNNENNKTVSTRFGGTEISSNAVTTVSTYQDHQSIQNRGVNAQVFVYGGFSFTGAPIGTLDKNTAKSQLIEIVGQLSDADDVITLEAYTVELIPSP